MTGLTEKILDYLQVQAENTVDLLDIMMSDRRTAIRKARRSIIHGPPEFKTRWADYYRERQQFYSLLNRLKRDGLVKKKKYAKYSRWYITKSGTERLSQIKSKPPPSLRIQRRVYQKNERVALIVVSFDVPERERRKRNWLRSNLVALGFTMLQQSVWLGNHEIPADFMDDLRKYDMVSYVHIFSVDTLGSIVKK